MTENIEVFAQNSIRIRGSVGTIYVDPFKLSEASHDADYIFVTHDHYDHFSPEDIAKVAKEGTLLIAPERMRKKAESDSGIARIESVLPGNSYAVDGLNFETVAMYNIMKPFHPKASQWCGYILSVDGERIYIAGDLDLIKEAQDVKRDIALVPVGGFYTMDAKKAAELVNTIAPKVAIPVHYGSEVGNPKDGEAFAGFVKEGIEVVIKIPN